MSRRLWWWLPHRRWRIVATVSEADEVPLVLPRHGVVVVYHLWKQPKWVVFDCPCGAERIMINTDLRRLPAWKLHAGPVRGVTIHPSVDTRHNGHRCHYLVRRGRTVWVPQRIGAEE